MTLTTHTLLLWICCDYRWIELHTHARYHPYQVIYRCHLDQKKKQFPSCDLCDSSHFSFHCYMYSCHHWTPSGCQAAVPLNDLLFLHHTEDSCTFDCPDALTGWSPKWVLLDCIVRDLVFFQRRYRMKYCPHLTQRLKHLLSWPRKDKLVQAKKKNKNLALSLLSTIKEVICLCLGNWRIAFAWSQGRRWVMLKEAQHLDSFIIPFLVWVFGEYFFHFLPSFLLSPSICTTCYLLTLWYMLPHRNHSPLFIWSLICLEWWE